MLFQSIYVLLWLISIIDIAKSQSIDTDHVISDEFRAHEEILLQKDLHLENILKYHSNFNISKQKAFKDEVLMYITPWHRKGMLI